MQYFNFERLITKYKSAVTLVLSVQGGYDENGDYVKTSTSKEVEGAVISITDSKLYRSDGTLTAKDKVLYMLEPIKNDLQGAKVTYKGNLYSIDNCKEDFEFTGVYAYTLKYVSAFDESSGAKDIAKEINKLSMRLDGSEFDKSDGSKDITEDIERLGKRLDGELND